MVRRERVRERDSYREGRGLGREMVIGKGEG